LKLSKSLEDYLETILLITYEKGEVRITDIAKRLNIKEASVVEALKKLKNLGLVEYEKGRRPILTEEGKRIAREIYEKHQVLLRFLQEVLGVSEEVAIRDACAMEHVLSKETLEKIAEFMRRREDVS